MQQALAAQTGQGPGRALARGHHQAHAAGAALHQVEQHAVDLGPAGAVQVIDEQGDSAARRGDDLVDGGQVAHRIRIKRLQTRALGQGRVAQAVGFEGQHQAGQQAVGFLVRLVQREPGHAERAACGL